MTIVTSEYKPHNFLTATIPLICLIFLMTLSVHVFGSDSSQGPNQVALFICTIMAIVIGLWRGMKYDDIEHGIVQGISVALNASLILLFIGALIGVWLLSGTVPTLIYYGVQIINPAWFFTCAVLVCALVSISIGSSWSTCATIGVAFIGMSVPLGMPIELTAGAVISGSYFGDKNSPLSETTNLAAAVGEVNLFDHIRNMLWTTGPSLLITVIIFSVLGWHYYGIADNPVITSMELISNLEKYYNISLLNLLPLFLLIVLTIMRLPVLIILFISTVAGAIMALCFQGDAIAATFHHTNNFADNLISIWRASFGGVEMSTSNSELNELLSGGGMKAMLNTIFLLIAALSFGSAMETTGSIAYMIGHLLRFAKTAAKVMVATVLSCIGLNIVTGDQYMSIIMPGRMYKKAYKNLGLGNLALTRNLEDGATITSVLVPWNTCAVFVSGVIGVSTLSYAPYCFFNIISPIIAIIFSIFGIKIVKEMKQSQNQTTETKAI